VSNTYDGANFGNRTQERSHNFFRGVQNQIQKHKIILILKNFQWGPYPSLPVRAQKTWYLSNKSINNSLYFEEEPSLEFILEGSNEAQRLQAHSQGEGGFGRQPAWGKCLAGRSGGTIVTNPYDGVNYGDKSPLFAKNSSIS